MRRQLLALLVCVGTVPACGGASVPTRMADGGHSFPRPAHVAVMVLENRSYEQVIGSAHAPYINKLARRNALATRYYAIAHPSLPNYVALTGGSVFGIERNCSVCEGDGPTIVYSPHGDAGPDPEANLRLVADLVRRARDAGADFIMTPEASNLIAAANERRDRARPEADDPFLAGMRERVEQMGGELKITSKRGMGTKLSVMLPLNGGLVS